MMCIDFMKMVNGEYHEPQIVYNMKGLLNEIKQRFPDDPNPDPNNPKYKDIVKSMPYAPLIAGGLAKSLGIADEFMTLELWRDMSNGYCPAKYLPKVNEAQSLQRFAVETPRGLMVKFNKTATPIGPNGDYLVEEAEKDRRIGTEFVFGLGRNTSNVLTALELADPEVEMKVTSEVNRIFSEIIMPEMERDAYVRIAADGAELNYVSKLLAVVYHHTENRGTEGKGPEAYKHWHFDLMNVALDDEGEKLLSMCNDLIIQNKDKYTALLQRELMPYLKKELGLTFQPVYLDEDRDNPFLQDHEKNIASWDVEDKFIPQSLRDDLGARAKEMDAEMKKHGVKSFSALEIARKETRDAKTEMSPSELKAHWAQQYAKHGFTAKSFAQHQDFNQVYDPKVELPDPELMVANYVRKHKENYFTEDQLKSHVLKQLINICPPDAAERYAEYVFSTQCHQSLDKNQTEYFQGFLDETLTNAEERKQKQIRFGRDVVFTTSAILMMDKYNVESHEQRKDERGFILAKNTVLEAILAEERALSKPGKPMQFSMGQKESMIMCMTAPGSISSIKGRAGAGKSTLIKVVVKKYEEEGYNLYGTSISSTATKSLAESTGMKSSQAFNSTDLIKRLEAGKVKFNKKTILVIDEAGMMDLESLYKLNKAINNVGGKIILVGEKEQLQSVGLPAGFGVMTERFVSTPVKDINRQRDHWQREMVEDFASGRANDALDKLYANGKVVIKKTEQGRLAQIVNDYVSDKTPARDKLIIAATNDDLERINSEVRKELKKLKQLPEDEITLRGKDGIDRQFSVGDRLIFTKNQKSDNVEQKKLANSETGKVLSISRFLNGKAHAIQIEMDDGTKHHLNLNKEHSIKHAYAVTVHKSQGQTKENAYYWVSKNLNSLHSAYVACSRHRGNLKMYLSEDMVETLASKMQGKPPTAMMLKVATITAKKKGLEIPPETLKSFMETRAWLDTHYENPDPAKGRRASSVLDDFKSIAESMSKTNYKRTTWEYELADGKAHNTYKRIREERGYTKQVAPESVGPPKPVHQVDQVQVTLSTKAAAQAKELVRKAVVMAQKARDAFTRPPEAATKSINDIKHISELPQMKATVKKPVFTPDLNNLNKPAKKREFGKKKGLSQTL